MHRHSRRARRVKTDLEKDSDIADVIAIIGIMVGV